MRHSPPVYLPDEIWRFFDRYVLRNIRGVNGVHTEWIEVVVDTEDEEAPVPSVTVAGGGPLSFLAYEIDNSGLPDWWHEELVKTGGGYFRLTYGYDMETEYSEGYPQYSYDIITDIIELRRDWRARLAFSVWRCHNRLMNLCFYMSAPFRPIWAVREERGNFGYHTCSTWIPRAAWWLVKKRRNKFLRDSPSRYRLVISFW